MLTLVCGAIAGGYLATRQIRAFVYQSDFFQIANDQIVIDGASPTLRGDAESRLRALLPECENNLVRLDAPGLASALTALPRARSATVSKNYPQGLRIHFDEREPLMLVNLDKPYLIDKDGILLATVAPREARALGLPVLTGVRDAAAVPGDRLDRPRLASVLEAAAFLRHNDPTVDQAITEWNIAGTEEVSAILTSGATVRFGAQPPLQLLDKLSAALSRKPQLIKQAEYIDLRMARQVVYNMRNG